MRVPGEGAKRFMAQAQQGPIEYGQMCDADRIHIAHKRS